MSLIFSFETKVSNDGLYNTVLFYIIFIKNMLLNNKFKFKNKPGEEGN